MRVKPNYTIAIVPAKCVRPTNVLVMHVSDYETTKDEEETDATISTGHGITQRLITELFSPNQGSMLKDH